MKKSISLNGMKIGPESPLTLIAGPCVLESKTMIEEIAGHLQALCSDFNVNFIFKGSFDKANRTSIHSKRGPGHEEGLRLLEFVKSTFNVPVTTDIHEAHQANEVGSVVDIIQIPAFLCRQTDLLNAAAQTGKIVNVKKGQFISPIEMRHVVSKLEDSGCTQSILTERGTFFGYSRLVNDFIGLGDLQEIGPPVCFDVTHSTQLPGADTQQTGGRPDRALLLAKAATASNVDALFVECHPEPAKGHSDASTMLELGSMNELIQICSEIHKTVHQMGQN